MSIMDYNEKRWKHHCSKGTIFTCKRCDFKAPIFYKTRTDITTSQLIADVAEMIAYHSLIIWPELNGFSGYDNLKFIEIFDDIVINIISEEE